MSRPDSKFVSQMIFGILSGQSCHLSKIARALHEPISVKKVIDRLSRNLNEFSEGFQLQENYLAEVKGCLSDRAVLVIDDGDITKPCSKKLECLGRVKDGSTGGYGLGYHTLEVTALTPEQKTPISVYSRIYSAQEPDFVSADMEVLKALSFLGRHFKRNTIRAFDRGFDANVYYEYLIDHKEKFVIRSKKNRDVIYKGERVNILKAAGHYKGKYSLKYKKKGGRVVDCKISIAPIRMCCRPDVELNLVICHGFGYDPMLLITNLKSDDPRLAVTVTKVYLMRWKIEEYYGFKKQQFAFEDFRVRSLKSIRNLNLLLTIAIGRIGILSEKSAEKPVVMNLIHISKRINKAPKFKLYAIADGLFAVLAASKTGILSIMKKKPLDKQLTLLRIAGFAA